MSINFNITAVFSTYFVHLLLCMIEPILLNICAYVRMYVSILDHHIISMPCLLTSLGYPSIFGKDTPSNKLYLETHLSSPRFLISSSCCFLSSFYDISTTALVWLFLTLIVPS